MGPVVVLGASSEPSRYSYLCMQTLKEKGFKRLPVHPREQIIDGEKVYPNLLALQGQLIDTVTMYVGPSLSSKMSDDLLRLKPRRVIFNPGSENPELQAKLAHEGIEVVEACTLVMLRTGQF
jgi:uncharacterized protein